MRGSRITHRGLTVPQCLQSQIRQRGAGKHRDGYVASSNV